MVDQIPSQLLWVEKFDKKDRDHGHGHGRGQATNRNHEAKSKDQDIVNEFWTKKETSCDIEIDTTGELYSYDSWQVDHKRF